jgi:hypothetical protein
MPGGRPTKYDPKYAKQIITFFKIEPYKQVITEKITEYFKEGTIKKKAAKYRLIPNKMPTLFSFAQTIGVNYDTVREWKNERYRDDYENEALRGQLKHPEFSVAYKEAKQLQKEFLISIGLAGAAPAAFAIFTAKNVTNMRDRQEVTGKDGAPLILTPELAAKYGVNTGAKGHRKG